MPHDISHFTMFFRESNLTAIAEDIAPGMYRSLDRPLAIRHVGAASMKEVYSLTAMLDANGVDFRSVGHDTNRRLLRKGPWGYRVHHWPPLRFVLDPDKVRKYIDPYFVQKPSWTFDDRIKVVPVARLVERVTPQRHDILKAPAPGHADITVMNNVLFWVDAAVRDCMVTNALAGMPAGSVFSFEPSRYNSGHVEDYETWAQSLDRLGLVPCAQAPANLQDRIFTYQPTA